MVDAIEKITSKGEILTRDLGGKYDTHGVTQAIIQQIKDFQLKTKMTINSKNIGLISGPLAFIPVLFFFHPEGLNSKVSAILACTSWIAI